MVCWKSCVCVELFNNNATENDLHVTKNHKKKHRWIRFMIVIIWHCFPVAMGPVVLMENSVLVSFFTYRQQLLAPNISLEIQNVTQLINVRIISIISMSRKIIVVRIRLASRFSLLFFFFLVKSRFSFYHEDRCFILKSLMFMLSGPFYR